jgi:uncharacterized protein (DUF1501 family)
MNRRHFLLSSAGALLTGGAVSSWAVAATPRNQGASGPRLLFVLLRGGLDTDSVLFQHSNDFYYQQRPNIAVSKQGFLQDGQRLNDMWAVHPAFEPLFPWIQRKEMAFVPFSGTQDNSRSHFTAQDVLEHGWGPGKSKTQSGLLNRILTEFGQQSGKIGGVSFVNGVPAMCAGSAEFPYVNPRQGLDPKAGELQDQKLKTLQAMYLDPSTNERLKAVSAKQTGARDTLRTEMDMGAEHGASAKTSPGVQSQFGQMAKLMRTGGPFSIGFADIGGWDTHQGQGSDVGWLSGRLGQLADALAAFAQGMGPAWADTHVVIMSEFGRTFAENGTRGTDHGHGTTMMLMSGRPYRDNVLGEQVLYRPETLHEQRDSPILNPYKPVLIEHVLARMGLPTAAAKRALLI